ncbi:TRAP transporter small permease [Denitrobaculum tricleocarpae]|uniref:TRAP transporter small permease protein n=1 Tax=Denitrobaculum tricleocarpae TaxID=2591009 RepID=A0A545TKT5_9PROT|nr:TRAP transporter small permease subunit [Denitrobaculum tricleocarpae]TQV77835.1 TRAP transporter small permease subunit [Denitrobaculum tricleocarpae]
MIKRALEAFCQVLRVAVGVLIAALIVPVAMQVIARYTGLIPVYLWTEELAKFIFIWIVMLGSMIAVWEGTHFDVHVVPDARTRLGKLIQRGFVLAMVSLFAVLFAYYGIGYAKFGSIQQSVMMQVNLLVIYITVPLAGIGWALFALYRLWEAVCDFRQTRGVAE